MDKQELTKQKCELANLDIDHLARLANRWDLFYEEFKHEILLKCMFALMEKGWEFTFYNNYLEIYSDIIEDNEVFFYDPDKLSALELAIGYILESEQYE